MSNIKKARYSKAYKMASTLEWVHKDIGVIKITGKPDNIKQINIFLPIGVKKCLFALCYQVFL
jgi:hypothetical protein